MSPAATRPIAGHDRLDATIAWHAGRPVSVARFVAETEHLAASLPPGGTLVNLCEDRYRFAVAFAAALLSGKTSLFPPNRAGKTVAEVGHAYPGAIAIADAPQPDLDLPVFVFPSAMPQRFAAHVPEIDVAHPAAIVFTSGSTGVPQPHLKRWGHLFESGLAERSALDLPGQFNVLGTVPPQHMYGFESSVLMPLAAGGAFHAGRPLLPADVHAALDSLPAPRVLVTTPIHIRACIEAGVALPALELVLSAAAPLAPTLAAEAERRFGARVMEIYGFSEAGQVACRRTTTSPLWRPLPGIRLVPGADGLAFEGGPVHGRVRSSDLLRPAADGTFLLEGRAADLVNVAGKRASLGDLTHKLVAIPGVVDGVFYAPEEEDDAPAARLMAFVVAPGLAEEAILRALRESIDPAFLPRPLVKVDALPRAATGKLPLQALRALAAKVRARARQGAPVKDAS